LDRLLRRGREQAPREERREHGGHGTADDGHESTSAASSGQGARSRAPAPGTSRTRTVASAPRKVPPKDQMRRTGGGEVAKGELVTAGTTTRTAGARRTGWGTTDGRAQAWPLPASAASGARTAGAQQPAEAAFRPTSGS